MHIDLVLPNPLGRLTRILVALERARGAESTTTRRDDGFPADREPLSNDPVDHHDDLESLSLMRCEPSLESGRDSLGLFALSTPLEARPQGAGILDDASLERLPPRRPGH